MGEIVNKVWHLSAILLALAAFGTMQTARAQDSGYERVTGTLAVVWEDPRPGSEEKPLVNYSVTDAKGIRTELIVDRKTVMPRGGIETLSGKQVKVVGDELSGARLAADKVEATTSTSTMQAAVSGAKPTATILCRFGDSTGVTPKPPSHFDALMGSTKPGLDHYWRESSYGKVNLNGSRTFGWFNLPRPESYYMDSGRVLHDKLAEDCATAADSQVNFPTFTNVNIMVNTYYSDYALGGKYVLNRDGQQKAYGWTWMPRWGYQTEPASLGGQHVLAHEMGHSFGLPHSSGPHGQTYDSSWDIMSEGSVCRTQHPSLGCLGVHPNAAHKLKLGWIPSSRIFNAPSSTNQTVDLTQLAAPGSSTGNLVAKIPIGGSETRYYTVESRRLANHDAETPGDAVVIHKVDTTNAQGLAQIATVVDTNSDGNNNVNDSSAMWLPGETFSDTTNNIQVRINSATSDGDNVTISSGVTPKASDSFAGAPPLTGLSVNATGSTATATKEPGEPEHANNPGGKSAWYRWTAPATSTVSVKTIGSDFDTLLGVYEGSVVNNLTHRASNDDASTATTTSRVAFRAFAGITYYIAIDGKNGASGNFKLAVSQPPDITAPTVTSSTPVPSKADVLRNSSIKLRFSEPMGKATLSPINMEIYPADFSAPIDTKITSTADGRTVVMNPTALNLASDARYYVILWRDSQGIKDASGNPLAPSSNYIQSSDGTYVYFSFTTGTA